MDRATPKRAVPSSRLILSRKGGSLNENSLRDYYTRTLKPHFTNLLNEAIGQEDRNQIQEMIRKPWNPYILRHSTATEFLGRRNLNADLGKQWFGWSENSNMPSIYENFDGHEAAEVLAEKFGLKPQTKQEFLPRLRECPNVTCKELNTPDAPLCAKCRVPLTVPGFMEQDKKKNDEIYEMKEQMLKMQHSLGSLQQDIQVMKGLDLRRLKDLVYGRKKFQQVVVEEMKLGKDFRTVLSQKLDPDVMMSHIKNDKKIPRIYKELVMEDLIGLKKEASKKKPD